MVVAPAGVKTLKDALAERGWLDQSRQIFRITEVPADSAPGATVGQMVVPVT